MQIFGIVLAIGLFVAFLFSPLPIAAPIVAGFVLVTIFRISFKKPLIATFLGLCVLIPLRFITTNDNLWDKLAEMSFIAALSMVIFVLYRRILNRILARYRSSHVSADEEIVSVEPIKNKSSNLLESIRERAKNQQVAEEDILEEDAGFEPLEAFEDTPVTKPEPVRTSTRLAKPTLQPLQKRKRPTLRRKPAPKRSRPTPIEQPVARRVPRPTRRSMSGFTNAPKVGASPTALRPPMKPATPPLEPIAKPTTLTPMQKQPTRTKKRPPRLIQG